MRREQSLTPEARAVLTADEVHAVTRGIPRPGYGYSDERYRAYLEAMEKVVAADHRFQRALAAAQQRADGLAQELDDGRSDASTIAEAARPLMRSEVEAVVTARAAVFKANGWIDEIATTDGRDLHHALTDRFSQRITLAVLRSRGNAR